MNRIKILFLPLLLILSSSFTAEAQKVGFTNVEVIMSAMPEYGTIERELTTFQDILAKRLKTKEEYYMAKIEEYQMAVQNGASKEEQSRMEQSIQSVQQEIQASMADAEKKMMMKQNELFEPLQERLQTAIDAVATEGDFTYILNQSASGGISNILYGIETMDVTLLVAKKLGLKVD